MMLRAVIPFEFLKGSKFALLLLRANSTWFLRLNSTLVFEPADTRKGSKVLYTLSIFSNSHETRCSVLVSLLTAGKQAWRRRDVPGTGDEAPDPVPCTVRSGHGRRLALETTELPDPAEDEGLLTQG